MEAKPTIERWQTDELSLSQTDDSKLTNGEAVAHKQTLKNKEDERTHKPIIGWWEKIGEEGKKLGENLGLLEKEGKKENL